jgi:TIR domain
LRLGWLETWASAPWLFIINLTRHRNSQRILPTMASVFISHRRSDASEAEHLAHDIRAAGHTVWLDDWEIDLGDSIVGRMQEGLAASRYLVLCYSTSDVLAPWISREWLSALARQMNGASVKLLPVVLTGGGPPAILSDIHYVDLTKDWDEAMGRLLRAIR